MARRPSLLASLLQFHEKGREVRAGFDQMTPEAGGFNVGMVEFCVCLARMGTGAPMARLEPALREQSSILG